MNHCTLEVSKVRLANPAFMLLALDSRLLPILYLNSINAFISASGCLFRFAATAPVPEITLLGRHMTGLNAVYDALGMARPTFDSIVAGATEIGKPQMDQVRDAIRAVESLSAG